MLSDAHCHPCDLIKVFPGMEEELLRLGVLCAANSSSSNEFNYVQTLATKAQGAGAPPVLPCFAIHPQVPVYVNTLSEEDEHQVEYSIERNCSLLENLADQGRLAAVGETGFDLFNAEYRETEAQQDEIFAFHCDTALRHDLPLILHVRKAMHKVFAYSKLLTKCKAVVFHSWPGTLDEAQAVLDKGINAYFSFGTTILLNHRKAQHSCALLPAHRLLTETDAPYQALRNQGRSYSSWEDLPMILNAVATLRREAGSPSSEPGELEDIIELNFRIVFM